MASMGEMWSQLVANFKSMTSGQRIAGLLIIAVIGGGLAVLISKGGNLDYRVLYSGLTQEDAAEVVTRLKENRTQYKLDDGGHSILVPATQVYEVRLTLAGEGLPRGGGVGFEVFDKSSFGTTDFVQRLNYQRALQGELARTIRQFQQVLEARVHIATPKESVFVEDEKPVTASISVKLRNGSTLTSLQVQSIVNLVASAVPGLRSDSITLVDTSGRLLFRQNDDSAAIMTASQLEYQQHLEESLRHKVESMLEEVVGVNKVKARVTADLDFSKVNVTEELFDPDGQVVRSEQKLVEGDGTKGLSDQGIPGVKGELATYSDSGTSGETVGGYNRNNITRNYEISRTTRHREEASGAVQRLSVAVMIDGAYEQSTDDKGGTSMSYKPRTSEELAFFDKLVKNAIGYNEERADQVEVISMAFALSSVVEPELTTMEKIEGPLRQFIGPLVYLFLGFGIIFLVIKPLMKILTSPMRMVPVTVAGGGRGLHAVVGGESEGPPGRETEEEMSLTPRGLTDKERMYRLAQTDPDRAADLVRRWLREEE
ncbi:MAG: flagellar M-ring protein FliF [Proteobacteria bacterium]|nr:flagellar M-ring protein FliF [Pseudomonadota bacterium]MBU1686812.1 flagellar M-ring protein FliF [Pseudomonadota bacterium]